jgi:hypothetical protein
MTRKAIYSSVLDEGLWPIGVELGFDPPVGGLDELFRVRDDCPVV